MIPKRPAPDVIRGGHRFSDKIMLKENRAGSLFEEKRSCVYDGMFLAQGGAIGNGALARQLALACSARGASSAPAVACRRWSRRRVRQQAEPPLRRKASSGVATTA